LNELHPLLRLDLGGVKQASVNLQYEYLGAACVVADGSKATQLALLNAEATAAELVEISPNMIL
jgi:hypothetical protein